MATLKGTLDKTGQLVVETQGFNPKILSNYGFRKAAGSAMRSTLRIPDLEVMSSAGIQVEPDVRVKAALDIQGKTLSTQERLQAAEDLVKRAQHPSWDRLMGHQRVGVGYLSITPRALLVYSPRLGKTPTVVIAAEVMKLSTVVFVTPKTLFRTIEGTIKEWGQNGQDTSVLISKGSPPKELPIGDNWIITNPESIALRKAEWMSFCAEQGVELLILDESILYKSHKSKRQQAAKALGDTVGRVWALTGNPTGRYSDQLYGQLNILRPDVFSSYWRFAGQWCHLTETPWSTEVSGNKDPEGLRKYLRDIMISRTPDDVKVLPELNFEMVEVELSKEQESLIEQLDHNMTLRDPHNPEERTQLTNVLQLMTRTAQIVSEPSSLGYSIPSGKRDAAMEIIETAAKPVLVWFQFVESLTAFSAYCRSQGLTTAEIHGGVSDQGRDKAIADFRSGAAQIICVQLQTGKFGLDLTAAKTIIYYDRSFDLDSWIQSTNRGRLIGMAQDKVAAGYVLHGGHTDYLIDKILLRKVSSLSEMSLSDLMEVTRSTSTRKKVRKVPSRKPIEAQ